MKIPKYLMCITRSRIASNEQRGMTSCPGSELILNTHCQFCDYYSGEEPVEEVESPVVLEKEEAEWS